MTSFINPRLQPRLQSDWLPPAASGKWRDFERKALEVRRFAGLGVFEPLDPFRLADMLKLRVVTLDDIAHLSQQSREYLTGSDNWSGGATKPLPDGTRIIIINDRHSVGRKAVTLMEEICHSLLGHDPSLISATASRGRSYDRIIEEEAYAVGAAALLPYRALSEALAGGESISKIARRFGVTRSLVEYRVRVLELW
jgi:hypothetical protein